MDNLNRSRHKHELYWEEGLQPYKCKGCKHFGANKGYKCGTCTKFILHKACANSGDEVSHNKTQLQFRRRTVRSHSCNACGVFLKGFMFQSSSSDLRLHPLCMMLPDTFIYSGHKEHSLKLVRETENDYICSQCREKFSGWRYRCEETKCRVILDLNCCIIDIHDLKGITKVAPPSHRKRILRKVFHGGKVLVGAAVKGTVEGFGEGLATAAVGGAAGLAFNNNEDDDDDDDDDEEEVDEDDEEDDEEDNET